MPFRLSFFTFSPLVGGRGLARSRLWGVPPASLSVESFFIPFSFRRRPQLCHGLLWLLRACTVSLSLDETTGDVDDGDDGLCVRFGLWVR